MSARQLRKDRRWRALCSELFVCTLFRQILADLTRPQCFPRPGAAVLRPADSPESLGPRKSENWGIDVIACLARLGTAKSACEFLRLLCVLGKALQAVG